MVQNFLGVPQPISYVPVVEYNPLGPKMGFIDRVNNFKEYLLLMFVQKYYIKKVCLQPKKSPIPLPLPSGWESKFLSTKINMVNSPPPPPHH
jgi:hypothetical protein